MKRKRAPAGIKKILVPSDFSGPSRRAMDYAAILAKESGAEILLLHVIESLPYSVTDTLHVIDHRRALEKTAGALLKNLREELIEKELAVKTRLASGTAYDEILKTSRREKADLIVMGTHGRTGMSHLLLGSVAEKVVRLAACPVLTVPDRTASRVKAAVERSVTLY
ncbi:MAG TPA: universal stress protein [Candidatus Binatia bacterium]|jgi:nucleotide-binding universal stress UspA family protein